MDDSAPDKYIQYWRSHIIAELDECFILLCDRDICTTMLLGKLYWFSHTAIEASDRINDDYHDPAIHNTIEGIATWFLNLFEVAQIKTALKYLADKEYITVWQSSSSNSLKVECYPDKVDEAIKSLKPTPRLIHSWEHSIEMAHKEAERRRNWVISTITEVTEIDTTAEETRRVKHHNSRAKKVGLPATLTIEQWLQTLDHFE